MDRNQIALTLFAAMVSNGRDPNGSLANAFKFADLFIAATEPEKAARSASKPRKKA